MSSFRVSTFTNHMGSQFPEANSLNRAALPLEVNWDRMWLEVEHYEKRVLVLMGFHLDLTWSLLVKEAHACRGKIRSGPYEISPSDVLVVLITKKMIFPTLWPALRTSHAHAEIYLWLVWCAGHSGKFIVVIRPAPFAPLLSISSSQPGGIKSKNNRLARKMKSRPGGANEKRIRRALEFWSPLAKPFSYQPLAKARSKGKKIKDSKINLCPPSPKVKGKVAAAKVGHIFILA